MAEALDDRRPLMRTLYLTFDGLLEPLGASQIVRPVIGLARRGLAYTILSLEKREDLRDRARVRALERDLRDADVRWVAAPYETGGGARNVATNVRRALALAYAEARRGDVALLHARAHLSAAVAWTVRRTTGLPYLFDFRGYWVDEQREQGKWVTQPAAYRIAKLGERMLVRDAAAVVCLTDLATHDVRCGGLGRAPRHVVTITTVADYREFTRSGSTERVPRGLRALLSDKLVVGYIGALNPSYATDASLELFRRVADQRSDAHLLCLTRQGDELRRSLERHGIPSGQVTLTDAPHEHLVQWLRLVDWGLLLLNSPFAKRGSMPTKLAEWFAAGVRPVQHGCNSEVSAWVRRAGSGLVLGSLSQRELKAAAEHIATTPRDEVAIWRARELTETHFGLEAGIEGYTTLLRQLLGDSHDVTELRDAASSR